MGSSIRAVNRGERRRTIASLKRVCSQGHPPVCYSGECPVCGIMGYAEAVIGGLRRDLDTESITRRALEWKAKGI